MESYIVSARKYRPKGFEEVVGQSSITQTLENALKTNHLGQALLFTGPRGVGKTTCARILARIVNEQDQTAKSDADFAFNIFELDAASNNSVDDIRNLIDQVRIPPQTGKFKIYIIDEVHMLSQQAFNAFLKTLEEPPAHAIFILATTEKHKIIPTILSRCQIFDFKRITVSDIREHLKKICEAEGVTAELEALQIIAQKADGALRDALSIFDRILSYCGTHISTEAVTQILNILDRDTYFKVTDLIFDKNIAELFLTLDDILNRGFNAQHFIAGLASHFRQLLVSIHKETHQLLDVSEDIKKRYAKQSAKFSPEDYRQLIDLANECDLNYKNSQNQRLLVELTLLKLASVKQGEALKKNTKPKLISPKQANTTSGQSAENNIEDNEQPTEVKSKENNTPKAVDRQKPDTENQKSEDDKTTHSKPDVVEEPSDVIKVSPHSIKALKLKKEAERKQLENAVPEDDLPTDDFTEEAFVSLWKAQIDQQKKLGNKLIASGMEIAQLEVNPPEIVLRVPNEGIVTDFDRFKGEILQTFRKSLNNYAIHFSFKIDESTTPKRAFTRTEKVKKMIEKNPNLRVLINELDLDID